MAQRCLAYTAVAGLLIHVAGFPVLPTSNSVQMRQVEDTSSSNSTDPLENEHNVEYWCPKPDFGDAEAVQDLWEGYRGIGDYLGVVAEGSTDTGRPNDNWLYVWASKVLPDIGDLGIADCGTFGGTCNPLSGSEDCAMTVAQGTGSTYWILRAVAGFHSKLNIMHEYLQDEVLDTHLGLADIAEDFSAPLSPPVSNIAGILSAALFVAGGVGGVVGVVSAFAGAAAMGAVGVAESNLSRASAGEMPTEEAERNLEHAKTQVDAAGKYGRTAGTESAGTYLLGSIMTTVAATVEEGEENQVDEDDLRGALQAVFRAGRERLGQIGRLAVGYAAEGELYSMLPHSDGIGGSIPNDNPVAGFFSDGKMLLSGHSESFNATVEDAFGVVKTKIVDLALQSGGFVVGADEDIDSDEDCRRATGGKWLDVGDGHCFMLKREVDGSTEVGQDTYDLLEDKYGFNIAKYYQFAYECTVDGDGGESDVDPIPVFSDTTVPTCFYGISARKFWQEKKCEFNVNTNKEYCEWNEIWGDF